MVGTKFKFLSGDVNFKQFGGKWITKKHNNGEFDYWLIASLTNLWDATGDTNQDQYYMVLSAVAPSQVPEKKLNSALESCGYASPDGKYKPEELAAILEDYGVRAVLYQGWSNNFRDLWNEMRAEATAIELLFGFYMDSPENAIGTTGWDMIKGDVLAPLNARKVLDQIEEDEEADEKFRDEAENQIHVDEVKDE